MAPRGVWLAILFVVLSPAAGVAGGIADPGNVITVPIVRGSKSIDDEYDRLYAEHCQSQSGDSPAYCAELGRIWAEQRWISQAIRQRDAHDAEMQARGCFADPSQTLTSYPPQSRWVCP